MADLTPAHELRSAVLAARMPPSCLRVYLSLLGHRSERDMHPGCAWPSVTTIGTESGLSERAVQDALRALKRHGWLEQVASPFRVAVYQLRVGEAIPKLIADRQPRSVYLEQLRAARCEPSHPTTGTSEGASRRTEGCEASHPWVRAVAPGGCEPSHPNSSVELFSELYPPIIPPSGGPEPEPIQPLPVQPELLSAPTSPTPPPKPKRSRGAPKTDTEQDPTWSAFAALAVEAGLVDAPPEPSTQHNSTTRGKALAGLVARYGSDRVLSVWRWVLTSRGSSATWWRKARIGGELVGSFLRPSNFEKIADGFDGERKHGVKLEVVRGGRAAFGQLPKIDESEHRHELELARRTLAIPNPVEEDLDDALCW